MYLIMRHEDKWGSGWVRRENLQIYDTIGAAKKCFSCKILREFPGGMYVSSNIFKEYVLPNYFFLSESEMKIKGETYWVFRLFVKNYTNNR